jgi:hypothetical protein
MWGYVFTGTNMSEEPVFSFRIDFHYFHSSTLKMEAAISAERQYTWRHALDDSSINIHRSESPSSHVETSSSVTYVNFCNFIPNSV